MKGGARMNLPALAPKPDEIAKRSKPSLVPRGKYLAPSDGKWHYELAAQYVVDHSHGWIPIGEIARVFYGTNINRTRKDVRRRLPKVRRDLFFMGHIFIVAFDHRTKRAMRCKLYDPRNIEER